MPGRVSDVVIYQVQTLLSDIATQTPPCGRPGDHTSQKSPSVTVWLLFHYNYGWPTIAALPAGTCRNHPNWAGLNPTSVDTEHMCVALPGLQGTARSLQQDLPSI